MKNLIGAGLITLIDILHTSSAAKLFYIPPNEVQTYFDAVKECENFGGHMSTIAGSVEHAEAEYLSKDLPVWVGLRQETESDSPWLWHDGSSITDDRTLHPHQDPLPYDKTSQKFIDDHLKTDDGNRDPQCAVMVSGKVGKVNCNLGFLEEPPPPAKPDKDAKEPLGYALARTKKMKALCHVLCGESGQACCPDDPECGAGLSCSLKTAQCGPSPG